LLVLLAAAVGRDHGGDSEHHHGEDAPEPARLADRLHDVAPPTQMTAVRTRIDLKNVYQIITRIESPHGPVAIGRSA
jgi:hypothetical protein